MIFLIDIIFSIVFFILFIMPAIVWVIVKLLSKKDIDSYEKARRIRNVYKTSFIIMSIPGVILIVLFMSRILENKDNYVQGSSLNVLQGHTTQEIEFYNNRIEPYAGKISGSQVCDLIDMLIVESDTHTYERELVPNVLFLDTYNGNVDEIKPNIRVISRSGDYYKIKLRELKEKIDDSQFYYITFDRDDGFNEGLIKTIIISYISNDDQSEIEKIENNIRSY